MEYFFAFMFNILGLQPERTSFSVIEESIKQQEFRQQEIACLQRIVYNESTNEPLLGKKLVAQTTVNRVNSGKFPSTVCANMKMRGSYSFYDPKSKHVDKIRKYPVEYKHIAEKALNGGYSHLISRNVLYFKRCDASSSFFNKLVMVTRSGNHCFFKEPKQLIADN